MKLQLFGEYFFEFIIVTCLLIISLILIIPFPFMIVGVTGYFSNDIYTRRYRDIFICIKENWKILSLYSSFEILIILFSSLNIYYINTNLSKVNGVMLVVSYIALIIGIVYLITAPTIIVNMNVNLKQLIINSFVLLLGNLKYTIYTILLIIGVILLILYFPYVIIFSFYIVSILVQRLMNENFCVLKAKALGISVDQLKHQQQYDDFESSGYQEGE